ncbi:unnamed protein product [Paramecium primaurelia]|uniref:WD40-repeat-containing domain n=1 Tax=Paramecium primaurelia TaxID=5886 RepID=A0A8S1PTP7_PARPR|nr:unnamed protein product [Paramecium primaurelia]
MFKPKMIENENTLQCIKKHSHPITSVNLDPNIEMEKRFLCDECLKDYKQKPKFSKIQSIFLDIEEEQNKKVKIIENIILTNIRQVEVIKNHLNSLRFNIIQLLDGMIMTTNDWIQTLMQKGIQCQEYSIIKEIDNFINQVQSNDLKILNSQVLQINETWIPKVNSKLNQFLNFYQYSNCKKAIDDLKSLNFQLEQFEQNIGYQQKQQDSIKLQLIDSFKQKDRCRAIAFDKTGQIMVTSSWKYIKIWKFIDGKYKYIQTLEGHSDYIFCFVFSMKQQAFLSGSVDKSIKLWKSSFQTQFQCTIAVEFHTAWVLNMILNQKEDLLFSGSRDSTINVWKVDLLQNQLNYLYTLNKHTKDVDALSLNQSESTLVSCGLDKQIIIWMKKSEDIYEFKYVVKQSIDIDGCKVKFLKDDVFIWVTGSYQLDKVFIFELKDGVFQENNEQSIQLIENNQIEDYGLCPIVYNQNNNIIFLRHKKHIYLIRQSTSGKFQIAQILNCETQSIDGGMTNNGKYLVFWDYQTKNYSQYLIEYL